MKKFYNLGARLLRLPFHLHILDASQIKKLNISILTHCIRVDTSTVICLTSPFVIFGLSDLFCRFSFIFDGTSY